MIRTMVVSKNQLMKWICITVLIIAGSAASIMAAEPVLRLRLGVAASDETESRARAGATLAKTIAEATEGKVVVELVVNTRPNGPAEVYNELRAGDLEMGLVDDWLLGRFYASLDILGQPFLYNSPGQATGFYSGPGGERAKEIVFNSSKMRIVSWLPLTAPVLLGSRSLVEPPDFQGLQVGSVYNNRPFAIAMAQLGAKVAQLPAEQLYGALAAGQVGAIVTTPAAIATANDSVGPKDVNEIGISFPHFAVTCGPAVWEQLGDFQDMFVQGVMSGCLEASIADNSENIDACGALESAGYVFYAPDRGTMRATFRNVVEKARATADSEVAETVEEAAKDSDIM